MQIPQEMLLNTSKELLRNTKIKQLLKLVQQKPTQYFDPTLPYKKQNKENESFNKILPKSKH